MKSLRRAKKLYAGFTIIEVMIVLAIAGLILVSVLVVVPQVQRNQRNETRKSTLTRIATEIGNYEGNNVGKLPVADSTSGTKNFASPLALKGFFNRYLQCSDASPATCGIDINDPKTGFPVGSGPDGTVKSVTTAVDDTSAEAGPDQGDLMYITGVICDGEALTAGTPRNYALEIRLEGGAAFCVDNK